MTDDGDDAYAADPWDLLDDDEAPVCTEGVTSAVLADTMEGETETVGHVLFADYDDDARLGDVLEDVTGDRADEAEPLEGLNAVFESSPGSFHLWNLTVRTLDATAVRKLSLRDDDLHAGTGYRAGQWTVRVTDKRLVTEAEPEGGETYKDAPELRAVWWNETDAAQSEPHRDLVTDAARRAGMMDTWAEACQQAATAGAEPVGDGLNVQRYYSGTDALKARWSR